MVERCLIKDNVYPKNHGNTNLLLGYEYKLQVPNNVGKLKSSESSHNRKTKFSHATVQQTCYLVQAPQNLLRRAQ